jgi:hypothetical protein
MLAGDEKDGLSGCPFVIVVLVMIVFSVSGDCLSATTPEGVALHVLMYQC